MNEEGRAMVKEKNPGAALTEVAKKCGEEWRALGEGAKKKYEKKQEEAKKKFDKEYKVWLENGGEEALKALRRNTRRNKRRPRRNSTRSTRFGWKTEAKALRRNTRRNKRRPRRNSTR